MWPPKINTKAILVCIVHCVRTCYRPVSCQTTDGDKIQRGGPEPCGAGIDPHLNTIVFIGFPSSFCRRSASRDNCLCRHKNNLCGIILRPITAKRSLLRLVELPQSTNQSLNISRIHQIHSEVISPTTLLIDPDAVSVDSGI